MWSAQAASCRCGIVEENTESKASRSHVLLLPTWSVQVNASYYLHEWNKEFLNLFFFVGY